MKDSDLSGATVLCWAVS